MSRRPAAVVVAGVTLVAALTACSPSTVEQLGEGVIDSGTGVSIDANEGRVVVEGEDSSAVIDMEEGARVEGEDGSVMTSRPEIPEDFPLTADQRVPGDVTLAMARSGSDDDFWNVHLETDVPGEQVADDARARLVDTFTVDRENRTEIDGTFIATMELSNDEWVVAVLIQSEETPTRVGYSVQPVR